VTGTPGVPSPSSDWFPATLAGILFLVLLAALREILAPPLVFAVLVLAAWPIRGLPGIRVALVAGALLTLAWVLHRYGSLLGPFVLALALAYLLAPLVARVERRGVGRGLAIMLVAIPPLAVAVGLIVVAGPQIWDQAVTLASAVPRFATTVLDSAQGLRARLESLTVLTEAQRTWIHDFNGQELATLLQQNADQILQQAGEWGWAMVRQLGTLVGFLGYLVVTPVVAFYVLRDWARLLSFLEGLIPPARRAGVVRLLDDYDAALGRFFRGQLIEATLVGVLTGTGLALLGVPSALLLGAIAGLGNLVPYVGLAVSAVPALIVALTMPSPLGGLLRVAGVFAVVQFIDGSVTGPRIVGNSVGLHPAVIMLALAFGGALLGFAGLLLAVPLAVLGKQLGTLALERYRASGVYAE
jgi:predicted PurR-regulated permease PerM